MFYRCNVLLLHLNYKHSPDSPTDTHTYSVEELPWCLIWIHAVIRSHIFFFFSCLCFDSCLRLWGLSGQEAEKAADKDKYNYWESNRPQTHGFLSYLHLFCCILTATPGQTSCAVADSKGFTNVVIKVNYSPTLWRWETIPSACIGICIYKL